VDFVASEPYTVGAEWELQLLDVETLDLSPGITTVLRSFSENEHVKAEFIQSCVELNTPIATCSAEIFSHFEKLTGEVLHNCWRDNIDLAAAGTHPFCRRLALITPLPRYARLASEHGYLAHSQIAFATHVHVGVRTGDEAVRAMQYLTPCLPLLIAIAANSPFWRGHETGYASYRRRLLAASRSYGIPPYFEQWNDFAKFFAMAKRAGSIRSIKDIHWDIRPHPDFGTVECRVMDAQSTVRDVAFLAGLVRLLVAWIGETDKNDIEAVLPRRLSPWIDRDNHFRASHWGMEAELIDDTSGQLRPLRTYLQVLVDAMRGTARTIGEEAIVDRLQRTAERTMGYELQRSLYERRHDVRDIVAGLNQELRREVEGQL
jgi:carboxylate-amine ligase